MRLIDLFGLLLVQVIWGFHFAISKIGLQEIPPLLLMALRFSLVAILLAPFFSRLPKGKWRAVAPLSLTFGSLNFGLIWAGVAHLDASTASIVNQSGVPFSAMLAAYFYGDRFGWRRMAGLALSFLGIVLVVGQPKMDGSFIWVLCVLAGTFASSYANIQIRALGPVDSFALSGWNALFTAPQLMVLSFFLEDRQWEVITQASWHAWASLAYTVVIVAIGSYCLWYPAIRRYPLNQVMPFTLLVPVLGLFSGVLLLGETLTWHALAGGAATVAGVAIIVLGKPITVKKSADGGVAVR